MKRTDGQWMLNFEIQGAERENVLSRAGEILSRWGLVMPPGDPLTPHFGLNDYDRIGEIEYWVVNDRENSYCGKFLFLFENQRCPAHFHRIKHETFFMIRGSVNMTVDCQDRLLRAGETLAMPPLQRHTFAAIGGAALILEISLPSMANDNFFDDQRIGKSGIL
ncbi:MAG: cupin domain-containing protein [Verrucomicrobiae bacterium]|nr:cupin domain-containing protein [Verrucomicrobiae bacterium]